MKDQTRYPAPGDPEELDELAGEELGDDGGEDGDDDEAPRTPLAGIGHGLRRLRMQRGLRQYEAAQAAGVTKAMLSAYETGKRRPSLKTLDSLLTAMDADLGDLHRALTSHRREASYLAGDASVPRWDLGEPRLVGGEPPAAGGRSWVGLGTPVDVYELLGLSDPLPPQEEQALGETLHGFLKLLRYMHLGFAATAAGRRRSRGPFDGG